MVWDDGFPGGCFPIFLPQPARIGKCGRISAGRDDGAGERDRGYAGTQGQPREEHPAQRCDRHQHGDRRADPDNSRASAGRIPGAIAAELDHDRGTGIGEHRFRFYTVEQIPASSDRGGIGHHQQRHAGTDRAVIVDLSGCTTHLVGLGSAAHRHRRDGIGEHPAHP